MGVNKEAKSQKGDKSGQLGGVVVMAGAKHQLLKRWLLLAVAVVIVAGGAGGYLYWQSSKNGSSTVLTPAQDQKYQAITKQIEQDDNSGNYSQKAKDIQNYLASNPPKAQQGGLTQQLASAYMRTGDYQKALDEFKKSESDNDLKLASYSGQAAAYEKLGNTQMAIETHQKIITLLQSQQGGKTSSKLIMEQDEVKRLEAGQ